MNVVFCSSEVFPFAKTGGLGDVCGSLPIALEKRGVNVTIIMPGYKCVGQAGCAIEPVTNEISKTKIGKDIPVYFIEHEHYFGRDGLYVDASGDYPDNLDRFSHYCYKVLELLKSLDLRTDIIHCHDWQTALIPVFLKEKYAQDEFYAHTKTILTIHNLAFQGVFPKTQYEKLGLESSFAFESLAYYDQICFLKAGIICSDKLTTVSSQYAQEIQTKAFGCGLDSVIRKRYDGVTGILNGLDHDVWDPATDLFIAKTYSANDFDEAKLANKIQLQKELGLDARDDVPLLGFVGRLSHQKGVDLLFEALEDLVEMNMQLVLLGIGEGHYQAKLKELAALYSDHIAVCLEFKESLGHQIYAGSDLFLMPSRFEPCGLSQLISLKYATIPVVFKTGGLVDTINPYGDLHKNGNGFVFTEYTKDAFLKALQKAVKVFEEDKKFHHLRQNALRCDFSWERSAHVYQEIYNTVERQ